MSGYGIGRAGSIIGASSSSSDTYMSGYGIGGAGCIIGAAASSSDTTCILMCIFKLTFHEKDLPQPSQLQEKGFSPV